MPGLPEILNILDEIRGALDQPVKPVHQSRLPVVWFEEPLPISYRSSFRPPRYCCPLLSHADRKNNLKPSEQKEADKHFQLALDVSSFKPEEISVKVKDRDVFIEAKHEEREDEHGFVSRQFTRRFMLPDEYDPDTISTYLNADGKMTVKALKPKVDVSVKERIIPVKRVSESDEMEVEHTKKHKDSEKDATVEANGHKEQ